MTAPARFGVPHAVVLGALRLCSETTVTPRSPGVSVSGHPYGYHQLPLHASAGEPRVIGVFKSPWLEAEARVGIAQEREESPPL